MINGYSLTEPYMNPAVQTLPCEGTIRPTGEVTC